MANDIITTLHPEQDENTNLYPNIKRENIPNGAVNKNKLDESIIEELEDLHNYDDILNLKIENLNNGQPSYVGTASQILALTENKGIAVATDTGYWYYWNGTQYVSSGKLYQSTAIGDGTIYESNFIPRLEYLANEKNVASIDATYVNSSISSITGELTGDNPIRVASSDFIEINPLYHYIVKYFNTYSIIIYCYNSAGSFLYEEGGWSYDGYIFKPKYNVTKIRLLIKHNNNINISASNWKNFGIALYKDTDFVPITNARSINNPIFKLMTFNVGFFHNGATRLPDNQVDAQRTRYKNMIKKYNPDIIVTQETTQYVNVSNNVAGESFFTFKYGNYLGTDGNQGKRFISNYFITSPIFYTFGSDGRDYQLSYVFINGIRIALITTHLSLDASLRASQLSTLLTAMNNIHALMPVILAGDLNIASLNELSGFVSAGYKLANGGVLGTFQTAFGTSENTDNVIVSDEIDLCCAEVDTEFDIFSDHRPFIVTLQIGSPSIPLPDTDGTYVLKLVKTNGAYKYQWVLEGE